MVVAKVLTDPAGDVPTVGGQAQLVAPPVGGLAFSGQPAPLLHAGGQTAHSALLQPEARGQILLGEGTYLGELAQSEHFRHRHAHAAVLVHRRVGLEQATCPHKVQEQSAQVVVREVR